MYDLMHFIAQICQLENIIRYVIYLTPLDFQTKRQIIDLQLWFYFFPLLL